MASRSIFLLGGSPRFLLSLTRTAALALLWGGTVAMILVDTASAADQYRLEGQVGLPHAGRVKQKVQVMSFENTASPLRGGSSGGNIGSHYSGGDFTTASPGGSRQVRNRDTYEYKEMRPLVFLQLSGDDRHCLKVDAPKGRFKIDGLDAGTYKLTFAVPNLGYMEKMVTIAPDEVDKDRKLKLEFEFEPLGTAIEPVEREKISDKGSKAFEQGVKEYGKGKGKKAFKEFEKAVREDDHYAEAWEYMGMIQHTEQNLDDAEKYFRKSLGIDSNSYRSLADLGTILLLKGDPAGARGFYEKAMLIRPEDPQLRTQLGMALFQLQELSPALDQLVKARALDSKHFSQPQILAAEIFRLLGEGGKMAAELHDFLDNFPDDPKVPAVKQALASLGQ